jgi:hypothetical protein
VVRALQQDENVGESCPQLGIVRPNLNRFVEGLQSLFMESLLFQRGAEARKIIRLGICLIGATDPLNSGIVLFGVEAKQAHELKRVRMPGIKRKSPLATNLRVQMPSCSQMAKAGFVERSRGARAAFRSRQRFAGRYPAFTTIHLHNSGRTWINL